MTTTTDLPPTTLAVVAHGAGDLRVSEVRVRAPAPDETIVQVAYGGVCGSDLSYWMKGAAGQSILRAPLVLGHEVSGTVLVPAKDGSGPTAGTRVTVHPATPRGDGNTKFPADRPNLSPRGTYLGSAAHLPHCDGAFQRLVTLPARMLRSLPDNVDLRTGALAEPAAVAWHAVARAGDVTGKTALVVGAGPIGALTVAALRLAGALEIVAVDLHPYGLQVARRAGATRTLLATDSDQIAAVQADVVVESSGSVSGLASALYGAARAARVVMVGLLASGDQPLPISIAITRELEMTGSFRFNTEIDDVLAAMAAGDLDVSPVLTHEYDVTDSVEAFTVAKNAAASSKVLLKF
jgi:L-iditol 2-dehydrogenase/L-idonate 5-dehydrogenase